MNQWMSGKASYSDYYVQQRRQTSAMSKYNVLVVGGRGIHIYYELSERTREREGSTVNVCSIVV